MNVHLDFETRSEVDIWASGAWNYSAHPSTRVLCAAYAIDQGAVRVLSKDMLLFRQISELRELARDPSVLFTAHNAFFERCIWKNLMEDGFGLPPIPLQRWRCTMAKASALGLPLSLEKAAIAMNLPQRKDKHGRQVMLRMCKPLPGRKTIVYEERKDLYEILYAYCAQDVETERGLDNVLPDLIPQEQLVWFYDQLINSRGVSIDRDAVFRFVDILNDRTVKLNEELSALTGGYLTKGTQVAAMLDYLKRTGADLPDLQKATVAQAIEAGRLSDHQIQVLRLRQQLGKSSLAKYDKLLTATDEEGILRDCFTYHSAHTGRWGGKLVQLQNLPRGIKIDTDEAIQFIREHTLEDIEVKYGQDLMDVMSTCIRGMIVPSKGEELYVVDYSAIEARVVFALAEATLGLQEFKDADAGIGPEIYVSMARRIYYDETLTKENKDERTLGKTTILGCGFGMGGPKFQGTCANFGIDISEEQAEFIVGLYRSTYFQVRNFWYDTERAAMEAFNNPGRIVHQGKYLKWVYRKDWGYLFVQLPSGRRLSYQAPELVENRFGGESLSFMTEVNGQWVRQETYGGKLVENIVQGTARDLMAYSFEPLEHAGFKILMHTHDEIVSQRPIGENRIKEMIGIMCNRPAWAQDIPVMAEGFTCLRYKKG